MPLKSYFMYPLEDHQQGDITKCRSYQVNCDKTVTYGSHVAVVSQGSVALDDMEGQSPTLENHKKMDSLGLAVLSLEVIKKWTR